MTAQLRPALVLFAWLTFLTGIVYPLAITGIAQLVFPDRANGSLIMGADGRAIGSELIGQEFAPATTAAAAAHAKWFWGRPSATGPVPYTALNLERGTGSSGSNLGPTNPALLENVRARLAALDAADASVGLVRPGAGAESQPGGGAGRSPRVPIDLVTASGSGLDPHISPAAAEYQVLRVARARGVSEDAVRALVRAHTAGRSFGVLGEPVVNVLMLNRALERLPRTP